MRVAKLVSIRRYLLELSLLSRRQKKPSLKAQEAMEAQEQGSHKGTRSTCSFEHPLVYHANATYLIQSADYKVWGYFSPVRGRFCECELAR